MATTRTSTSTSDAASKFDEKVASTREKLAVKVAQIGLPTVAKVTGFPPRKLAQFVLSDPTLEMTDVLLAGLVALIPSRVWPKEADPTAIVRRGRKPGSRVINGATVRPAVESAPVAEEEEEGE